jgi:hypothetical protein
MHVFLSVVGQRIKSPTLFIGVPFYPLWLSTCACLCLCLLGFCFGGIMGCCPQKPKLLAKVKYTKLVLSDYD